MNENIGIEGIEETQDIVENEKPTLRYDRQLKNNNVDLEALKTKILKDNAEQKERDVLITQEAGYMNYLNNVDMKAIPEDGYSKKLVQQVMDSDQTLKSKVDDIKKVVTVSKLEECWKKIQEYGENQFNTHLVDSVRKLKDINKERLTELNIESSDFIFKALEDEFQKVGNVVMGKNIPNGNKNDMNFSERLSFELDKRIKKVNAELSKVR